MMIRILMVSTLAVAGCSKLDQVGRAPEFSDIAGSNQHFAMSSVPFPEEAGPQTETIASSLWTGGNESLFGDRRAAKRGDILTVVIEMNDSASISNSTGRNRSGQQSAGLPNLLGIPQHINDLLPDGAGMDKAYASKSSSTFKGSGTVNRSEKLTLRIAATVIDKLPNGVLRIEGQQEVRVNFELRELIVTGYVRPNDISRQNEITYDKIAGARISYGGRGQITDMQQPTYGQQVADIVLPF